MKTWLVAALLEGPCASAALTWHLVRRAPFEHLRERSHAARSSDAPRGASTTARELAPAARSSDAPRGASTTAGELPRSRQGAAPERPFADEREPGERGQASGGARAEDEAEPGEAGLPEAVADAAMSAAERDADMRLRAEFAREPVDAPWARGAEVLGRQMVDRIPELRSTSIECRSSMCELRPEVEEDVAGRAIMSLMRDRDVHTVFGSIRNTGDRDPADDVHEPVWYLARAMRESRTTPDKP